MALRPRSDGRLRNIKTEHDGSMLFARMWAFHWRYTWRQQHALQQQSGLHGLTQGAILNEEWPSQHPGNSSKSRLVPRSGQQRLTDG